jgi:hypothetical protein
MRSYEIICSLIAGNYPEGKRPVGRTRLRLVDNIKMDFRLNGIGSG